MAADRNRAQRSATVSGGRNNPQQFETDRNRRQQQGGSQAAKNLVVEHKGIVEHWWLVFALKSFDLSAFMAGDTLRRLFDVCSTAGIFAKIRVFASRSGPAVPLVYRGFYICQVTTQRQEQPDWLSG